MEVTEIKSERYVRVMKVIEIKCMYAVNFMERVRNEDVHKRCGNEVSIL
jgi:hypothetical protein